MLTLTWAGQVCRLAQEWVQDAQSLSVPGTKGLILSGKASFVLRRAMAPATCGATPHLLYAMIIIAIYAGGIWTGCQKVLKMQRIS
ncbi:MAG: hypothetical protein PHR71_10635 [Polaromonas sp.]|nr:hypothetical protein [Polaromonas sp.]